MNEPTTKAGEVSERTTLAAALEAEWYNGNIPEDAYRRLCKAAGLEPYPSASLSPEYGAVPTDFASTFHGYTCDLCSWGRADQPRSLADFVAHVNAEHPAGPLVEGAP